MSLRDRRSLSVEAISSFDLLAIDRAFYPKPRERTLRAPALSAVRGWKSIPCERGRPPPLPYP